MANVFDYLRWRGDLTFRAAPFCEVDNLILSLLSYLDFSGLAPEGTPLPLKDAARLYFDRHPLQEGALGALLPDQIQDLFLVCAESTRFSDVTLWGHRSLLDETLSLQFSATCFTLGCGSTFAAFRGTDDTLVGWKEDFNMAVQFPVPAQVEARLWLEEIARQTPDRLLLGGHSKGGNLAVYAAAFCTPAVRDRVDAVWSNDGPGFLPEMLDSPGFRAVRGRILSILPRSSVVGVLLSSDWDSAVVESSALAALQHDGLTWQVEGPRFVRAEKRSRSSRQVDKTFHNLLLELSPDQRRRVIDDVFSAGTELGARTITDLIANGRKRESLKALSDKLTGIEKDTRERIFRSLRAAFRAEDE